MVNNFFVFMISSAALTWQLLREDKVWRRHKAMKVSGEYLYAIVGFGSIHRIFYEAIV